MPARGNKGAARVRAVGKFFTGMNFRSTMRSAPGEPRCVDGKSGIVDVGRPPVTCLTVGNRDGEIARAGGAIGTGVGPSRTLEAQALGRRA